MIDRQFLFIMQFYRAQVVGWPPVRSFRKNALKNCNYVKVAVDGVPYLRKVDLQSYDSYEQLLTVLGGMFYCFKIRMEFFYVHKDLMIKSFIALLPQPFGQSISLI